MAVDDGRGGGGEIKGRRRSVGGEQLTQIAWREAGNVEKEWVKGTCLGCGMKIFVLVKEKGIQVEMGHKGCCTLRKAEQMAGERRSGKKPQLGSDWKGAAGRG